MKPGYHKSMDTNDELNREEIQYFQDTMKFLIWEIEIGCIDILLEASLLLSHLYIPRSTHMYQVYHIFGKLKKVIRRRLFLDLG